MSASRSIKFLLAGLTALSASACVSILPETEPVAVYRLSSPVARDSENPPGVIVEIERPRAPAGLASDDIAIERGPGHLAYLSGAAWISPAPVALQSLIVDTFHAEGNGVDPVYPSDAVRGEYELRIDLRSFEAVYDQGETGAPLIRVRFMARLVEESGRELVASRVFSTTRRANSNNVISVVDAFNAASTQVAGELADWTSTAIRARG